MLQSPPSAISSHASGDGPFGPLNDNRPLWRELVLTDAIADVTAVAMRFYDLNGLSRPTGADAVTQPPKELAPRSGYQSW
jgi:hypothetical protein